MINSHFNLIFFRILKINFTPLRDLPNFFGINLESNFVDQRSTIRICHICRIFRNFFIKMIGEGNLVTCPNLDKNFFF